MKVITHLSGQLEESELREPRGIVTMLHLEPSPGVHIKMCLGSVGLFFRRGDVAAAVPLSELVGIVLAHCPEFAEGVNPPSAQRLMVSTTAQKLVDQSKNPSAKNIGPKLADS